MVNRALDLLEIEGLFTGSDRIIVKPNYVFAKPPSAGITTDSRVVESLVEFAKASGAEVKIAEGGAGDTERAFDVVGIREVAARQGVDLVNLNRDARRNIRIEDGMALREVGLAVTTRSCSGIINVPKLKMHSMAFITLSMKNLMGFILPKSIMHTRIDEKIVDLAGLLKDKVKLNVVDGLVGAERNEGYGNPVKMGLIIAGRDMVAVDSVGASVMGVNPVEVPYLGMAQERGLGVSNMADIEVLGENISDVRRTFERPSKFRRIP